jgi:hypothetical protein
VLKDGFGLVGLDAFGHHVGDVHNHGGSQLEVVLGLYSLLGHGLCDAFAVTALELTREEVTQPSLEQGDDTSKEE